MRQPRHETGLEGLRQELHAAQRDLALAYGRFNRAVDPELVESCVYRISAEQARCNYLIRAIRSGLGSGLEEETPWI